VLRFHGWLACTSFRFARRGARFVTIVLWGRKKFSIVASIRYSNLSHEKKKFSIVLGDDCGNHVTAINAGIWCQPVGKVALPAGAAC
jgi:hypothetical protein